MNEGDSSIIQFDPPLPGTQTAFWSSPRELRVVFTSVEDLGDDAIVRLRQAAGVDFTVADALA